MEERPGLVEGSDFLRVCLRVTLRCAFGVGSDTQRQGRAWGVLCECVSCVSVCPVRAASCRGWDNALSLGT